MTTFKSVTSKISIIKWVNLFNFVDLFNFCRFISVWSIYTFDLVCFYMDFRSWLIYFRLVNLFIFCQFIYFIWRIWWCYYFLHWNRVMLKMHFWKYGPLETVGSCLFSFMNLKIQRSMIDVLFRKYSNLLHMFKLVS